MYPNFQHGNLVISKKLFKRNSDTLKVGEVYIIARHKKGVKKPYYAIKRLTDVKYNENTKKYLCYFLGDNPNESYDSRQYGYVDSKNVKSKVIYKLNTKLYGKKEV